MRIARRSILVAMLLCSVEASGQAGQDVPHIGYVYPAGARRGAVTTVAVGGQHLRGSTDVYVSGEGVRVAVVQHYPPLRNLDRDQRNELTRQLRESITARWSELAEQGRVEPAPPWEKLARLGLRGLRAAKSADETKTTAVELPLHPMLEGLEDKSLRELLHVRTLLLDIRKRQQNPQIGETVVIEATIDRDAALGDRELRLGTRQGLSNPMVFQVGALPETCHQEPDDPRLLDLLPPEPPADLPVTVNGQIMPGDVDRFRFRAEQGQQLVIQAHVRRLIPFLADAVPGWFQATLALYDARGHELVFADDYRFDPDPVLFYEVPESGEYELEIRDAIYRGREDFVYRISVGEQPFITSVFPLGSRTGGGRYAAIDGWNLPTERLYLDGDSDVNPTGTRSASEGHTVRAPSASDGRIRQKTWGQGERSSNPVTYAVDALRAEPEEEGNDTPADAQRITLPRIVNGRIDPAGDVDTFQFRGKAGGEVVAEVAARRLRSPLDSLLRLTDESGNVLAWNDDCEHKDGFLHTDFGSLTHHADSYLRARLPADGVYYVQLTDVQTHGGEAYGYRLRLEPPQPDFALCVAPSSINVPVGWSAPMYVHVSRENGFDGPIELCLRDATHGFSIDGAWIPAGRDRVRMTLTAPRRRLDEPVTLQLEGRATIGGMTVSRAVVPAEDMMQAFLYRHLVPSQELMVATTGRRRFAAPLELVGEGRVRIPAGGATRVRFSSTRRSRAPELELVLDDPPTGLTLGDVTVAPGELTFELAADGNAVQIGFADNLIVEVFTEITPPARDDRPPQPKRRVSLGVLPAIPFEIVRG